MQLQYLGVEERRKRGRQATRNNRQGRIGVEEANFGTATNLGCQSIGHLDIVAVLRNVKAQLFGNINGPSRAWFVLQTAKIGLDLSSVDFDL